MDKTHVVKLEDNHNRTKHVLSRIYKSVLYTYQHNYQSVYIQVRCRLMQDKHAYTIYRIS